ncbi:hypothetical protein TraAM80_09800 [Trypanosoma rangeli]|uniref:Uncharacterized protein n=1 Tax=Trypanosoma rangeli TaxID=5698 RepID=A0A422MTB5_TRYRA|nr:uncharacterized protein TraAM80_09800 [Trypanosoma rangeli]RNE96441.1 hypothetical protein TraAM80_09800 [Trypanosoma rangeli]|eukprot:RNE96441.1 hypothetical protein TraAM80_09800 [Trypanosoma rangeli]
MLGGVVLPCGLPASAAALWVRFASILLWLQLKGSWDAGGRGAEGEQRAFVRRIFSHAPCSRSRLGSFPGRAPCAVAVSSSGAASVATGAACVRAFEVPRRVPQPRIFLSTVLGNASTKCSELRQELGSIDGCVPEAVAFASTADLSLFIAGCCGPTRAAGASPGDGVNVSTQQGWTLRE